MADGICGLGGPAAEGCVVGATPFCLEFCGIPALGGTPGGPRGPFEGPGGLSGPPGGPCAFITVGGPCGPAGIPLGLGGPIPGGPSPGRIGGAAPGGPIGIPTGCGGIPLGPCCGAICCCGAWNESIGNFERVRSLWSGDFDSPVASCEAAPWHASWRSVPAFLECPTSIPRASLLEDVTTARVMQFVQADSSSSTSRN